MFKITLSNSNLATRVKSVIGVPDAFLSDDVVTSPDFKDKAQEYINNQLYDIREKYQDEVPEDIQSKIDMSAVYYICSLIGVTMPVRLPIRMENISTKTLLQTIDWYKFSEEMLSRCDSILSNMLKDEGITDDLGSTIIVLTDETVYPNTYM